MKIQFLLIGLISIALFGSTPVAVAHGRSGGGAGHGGGSWGGAWGGHGRSAWGGHGHRFHHGGRFFGPGFGFGYPWWWDYPGYSYYPYASQYYGDRYYGDSYYGDTYYGNRYYGSSDPRATKALQAALARRGYYHGSVDGLWGPETRNAIRSFQAHQGLPVTGQVDGRLIRALQS